MRDEGGRKITRIERENFLIKLNKETAFSGATIPEEVTLDGEKVKLKSLAFSVTKRRGEIDPGEIPTIDRIASLVSKKKKEMIHAIANDDLTYEEAYKVYQEARGLARALDTLYSAAEPKRSIDEEVKKAKLEEGKRWLGLVKRVYSKRERKLE